MLTWQPLTRSFAGCAEPRSPAVGARRTADGPGPWAGWPRGRRTRLATHDSGLAAAERLPLAADVAPPGQSTHRRDDRKSSGPEPDWRWLGTAVARLDPSKWRAAATRTFCEITGSRAGSGGDPAVQHATGCVGWPTALVPVRPAPLGALPPSDRHSGHCPDAGWHTAARECAAPYYRC